MSVALDAIDRAIVQASQAGLALLPQPYHAIAEQVGATPEAVMQRMRAMLDDGVIRRIGAVPNHYALGYHANGMSVWDIADQYVDECGERIGALDFVTHCYRRPRRLPGWPYNLFAMVHGSDRAEVSDKVAQIKALLDMHCHAHDVLYSTRILKKTGLRI